MDTRETRIARQNQRDFPDLGGNRDLVLAFHGSFVARDAGDDIDLLVLETRQIAKVVLHVRPGALVQVRRLGDDVGQVEGSRVIEGSRSAVERTREVASVNRVPGRCTGPCIVGGIEMRVVGRQQRIMGEAIASILVAELRGIQVVAHPIRRVPILVERGDVLRPANDEVVAWISVGRLTEFCIARVLCSSSLRCNGCR